MRRQGAVFEPAVDEDPSDPVGVQHERGIAGYGVNTSAISQIARVVRTLLQIEVRAVKAGPSLLLIIPPNEFLFFAPWLAVGRSRSAVVDDAAVIRPGK